MVTSSDLDAAVASLASAHRSVDTALTEATGVGSRLDTLSQDTGWWMGPQGDDVRRLLTSTAAAGKGAWHPLTAIASQISSLQTTAEALAARLRTLESERRRLAFQSIRPVTILGLISEITGPSVQEQAAAIDGQIYDIDLEWTNACRNAEDVLFGAAAAVDAFAPTDEPLVLSGVELPPDGVLDILVATGRGEVSLAADPKAVQTWWTSLSADTQNLWLTVHPDLLGNTNGIPFEDRYRANLSVMQTVLEGLDPGDPEWSKIQPFLTNGKIDTEARIVFFDFAGDGRVAQVFGDIATASHVAVVVPGMGSTMSNFGTVRGDATDLHAETGGAVIAWTGYDAPAALDMSDPTKLMEVATDAQARHGGRDLAEFISAVEVETDADTTLIGHSYGSLTAGQALLHGAQVETVVFIGSPGVGVDHVDEFPQGAADRYFAGEITGDPVATLERFGDAPTDPDFGAIRFDAGSDDDLNLLDRHSSYFEDGIGLENLATIVEGGEPTPKDPTVLEDIIEFGEDGREVTNDVIDGTQSAIDFVQNIPTPLNPLGPLNPLNNIDNAIIDGGQTVLNTVNAISDPLIETAGNFATSAAEDAQDLVVDGVEEGKEFVDDRLEDGKKLLDDGLDKLGEINPLGWP